MSKIYLAARYSRNAEMRGHRDELVAMGHAVTSRWIDCHPDVVGDFSESFTQEALNARPELCAPLGQHDIDDLAAADTVISFTGQGGKGGRHVEFGYAAALGKGLIVVGARENIFHALPQVQHFADWATALTALGGMAEPERADRPGDQPDTCWLCKGLGGLALHMKWSEARGEALFTAHVPVSRSHPVHVCPACELADKDAEIGRLREQLAEAGQMVKICTGHPDTGHPPHADLVLQAKRERDEARSALEEARAEIERLQKDMRPRLIGDDGVCFGVNGEPGECTARTAHLASCPSGRPVAQEAGESGEPA